MNLDQELNRLFRELHKLPERIDQTTRLALKVPQRVWTGVTRNTDKSTLPFFQRPEYLESVRSGFRTKWPHWPLEDRIAALSLFTNLPAPIFEDEELVTFLREELGRQWAVKGDVENEDLEQEGKQRILRLLPEVDLADVRKVYDLSTSAGALAAWASHRLPFTAEVYEALSAARKVDDYEARYGFLNHWMRKAPDEIGYRVATEMASDPDELVRRVGLQHLAQRRSMDDVRVFEKALSDADDEVRFVAAEALAGVYDQAAIQALAKALDDPDPEVRDRVLQTLEAIRTVEEKKDYWRGFAEGKR